MSHIAGLFLSIIWLNEKTLFSLIVFHIFILFLLLISGNSCHPNVPFFCSLSRPENQNNRACLTHASAPMLSGTLTLIRIELMVKYKHKSKPHSSITQK